MSTRHSIRTLPQYYKLKPNKKPTPEHPEQVFHNHPVENGNKTPQP